MYSCQKRRSRDAQEADLALGPFVLTEREAMVANPSPPYTDEDMIILSGVAKEHKSNVYGYISAFDLHVWMVLLCFLGFVATVAVVAEYLVSTRALLGRPPGLGTPTGVLPTTGLKRNAELPLHFLSSAWVGHVCLNSLPLVFSLFRELLEAGRLLVPPGVHVARAYGR